MKKLTAMFLYIFILLTMLPCSTCNAGEIPIQSDAYTLGVVEAAASALLGGWSSKSSEVSDNALSEAALVGRWGNSGVKYGFSDDGYFYRSTVLSRFHTRSIYHASETRTWYSGDYRYTETKPGWWEYQHYTTYTYLNTLFGQYRVREGIIQFDNVVSIPHSNFDREWHSRETRGPDDDKFLEKFNKAEFYGDFVAEFEFINESRLRLIDRSTDRDFFWDFEDVKRNVQVPTHVIPPVEWPAGSLSPEMPKLKTNGRLRDSIIDDNSSKTRLIIDKTDALADIRNYVKTLRGAGWWVEEPGTDSTSLSLEARKGLWQLSIKNGNGSNTYADTIVIESTLYPVGIWPQAWTAAGLEPPQRSIIVGSVDNKIDESDRGIREKLYFDKVNDKGVENYATRLRQAGFKIPQHAGENWRYYKYIRVNGDLYRVEVTREGRYGEITAFQYDFKYFPDGEWPRIWREGGLPAPEGSEAIVGVIDMQNWDNKEKWYGSYSQNIKFLGLAQNKIDDYFKKLQSAGFTRKAQEYSNRVFFYSYLRIDGSLYRVEAEQQSNDELAEISYIFHYHNDGEWPKIWHEGGLISPEGHKAIVGTIDIVNWDNKEKWWSNSFTTNIKFLDLSQNEIDNYFSKLQTAGFIRNKQEYSDRVTYINHLRLGGIIYRVEIEQQSNDELTEISYGFKRFEDGVWPAIWREGGLLAPDGHKAIAGAIDMESWDNKEKWWSSSYSTNIKFLGIDQSRIDSYFSKLQAAGFIRRKQEYSDRVTYVNHLRLANSIYRVEIEQQSNDEIAEISYGFKYFENGEWPTTWRDGGLSAPEGYVAIAGTIDMESWDNKERWWSNSFSTSIKFLGLEQNKVDGYFVKLQSVGFMRKEHDYSDRVTYINHLRFNDGIYRVEIEQQSNDEIAEIRYAFNYFENGIWPADWQSMGIPAPRYSAIAGAFDLERWNDKNSWYGSFSTTMKFLDADLGSYVNLLKQNGFTVPEYSYRKWELEKRVRAGGVWYRVRISDAENNEIPEVRYEFREESN